MNISGRFLAILTLGLALVLPAQAFADVGIQLRVPYQASANDTKVGSAMGSGILISFDLDANTSVGLLSEQVSFTEKPAAAGAVDVNSTYMVNAIRLSKFVNELYYAAVDLGSGTNAVAQAPLADIVFGTHITGTKGGKMTSFFAGELMYRMFNPGKTMVAGGSATNYGGVVLAISAGLSF
ncbi:MAG: hypothetical protein HZA04_04975 [Nitrospinae bacterium]|nr:hypothetical protein [Nitrospinota bacterium]